MATVEQRDDGWAATVPDGEQVLAHDPRSITWELREQLGARLGLSRSAAQQEIRVELADRSGRPVHGFVLLFVPLGPPADYGAVRSAPPAGCRWFGAELPGLRCVRPGPTRLAAIADTVAALQAGYGLAAEASDLGFEKPWEWSADPEHGTDLVAQLLLMAAQRAGQLGIDPGELARFLQTAHAGSAPAPPHPAAQGHL
ncbi:hypothetical protein Athai_26820 [Actinocatenispora thailandica]|uniref:Uncharacterized protein n=1 Tax=Actinocatenispora thailandica TaxID=227318 RepID=A0A7R7HXK7_9ACTN|nr:hypothetical protein Athai_26820 [Actinocatenispora thailandica]